MAITKMLHVNSAEGRHPAAHLSNLIQYILNPEKTKDGFLTGALNCDKDHALEDMLATKEFYQKTDLRQGYHFIISFAPGEVDEETALEITARFCEMYLGEQYECVYAVHNDQEHMHGHIVFNSVNCLTGKKYHYVNGDWAKDIQPITNELCAEFGLETIDVAEPGLREFENYGQWLGNKNRFFELKQQMKEDIDEAIVASVDMDEVIEYLEIKNYKVRYGKKTMSLCPEGRKHGVRTNQLGYAYTPEGIQKRLDGEIIDLDSYDPPDAPEKAKVISAGKHMKGMHGIQNKNQYYAYETDARELQRINRQNLYMQKHHIITSADLTDRMNQLQVAVDNLEKQRRSIFQERAGHKDNIHMLHTMEPADADLSLLQQGYDPVTFREWEESSRKQLDYLRRMKKSVKAELIQCRNIKYRQGPAL